MNLVSVKNLNVSYGTFVAVKNVSLEINSGDYLCIVGANGSGKTTLVKAILGLIKPQSGSIEKSIKAFGYLPQQTSIQRDFPASVMEVVLSGFQKKHDKQKALEQMQKLGIEELAKKSFSELSGGQQQRVLLARALCAADKILVLDEPVTGLDPLVTDELYTLIRKLNRETRIAVLMISHDIHRAVQNATHILHMNNTELFFGTAEEYQKTTLYTEMSSVETCSTHLCTHCGTNCTSSHIKFHSINEGIK
jgi:zinc transport system ATP-binding protein